MSRGGGVANVLLSGATQGGDGDESSALVETNVLLRETDNELIEHMLGKMGSPSVLSESCESDRQHLLDGCRQSRFCGLNQMREHLSSMCVTSDLEEMSVHAVEQFVFIFSVILLCTVLHLTLITLEKLYYNCCTKRSRNKESEEQ